MSQEPEEGVEEVGLGCFCEMGFYLGELSWVKHHCLGDFLLIGPPYTFIFFHHKFLGEGKRFISFHLKG